MNIILQIYKIRKRLQDTEILRLKKIIDGEIERRNKNDVNNITRAK